MAGCVATDPQPSFREVERVVFGRIGQRVVWDQGTQGDLQVRDHIRAALAGNLTADVAVQVALLNNRALQARYEDLSIAQADLVQAGLLANPSFGLSVRMPGAGGPGLEFSLVEDFINLLLRPLRERVAAELLEKAKLEVAGVVVAHAVRTREAFYLAQWRTAALQKRTEAVTAAKASYEIAKRLHRVGNVTDLDLAAERAGYEESRIDTVQAEADLFDARERLNVLMGAWGADTGWAVGDRFQGPSADGPLDDVERRAVEQSLDLAAAWKAVEATANAAEMATAFRLLPAADIGVGAEREFESGSWAAGPGLQIPLPLFDQGTAAQAAKRSELRRALNDYHSLAVRVRSAARAARNRLALARERSQFFDRMVLPLRRQVVAETQRQYNAMAASAFQLLAAKRAEVEAEVRHIDALKEYWLARVELDGVLSGCLPPSGKGEEATETHEGRKVWSSQGGLWDR